MSLAGEPQVYELGKGCLLNGPVSYTLSAQSSDGICNRPAGPTNPASVWNCLDIS